MGMIVNSYKLPFPSSHFSSQPNKGKHKSFLSSHFFILPTKHTWWKIYILPSFSTLPSKQTQCVGLFYHTTGEHRCFFVKEEGFVAFVCFNFIGRHDMIIGLTQGKVVEFSVVVYLLIVNIKQLKSSSTHHTYIVH